MLLAATLAASAGASAVTPPAPLAIVEDLQPVRLAGEGSYRYFGLLIYDARLWVGSQGYRDSEPGAAPFVLELRYERSLQGGRIAQASAEQMEKLGLGSAEQRQAWLETMRGIFPDVREHDRIAGRYVPGQGVRFYLNGAPLAGRREAGMDPAMDDRFAQAFFAIWLSPRTTAPSLRKALLRDAAPKP
ncbi:hypothetical protein ASD15_24100 [Massilia sp. Root351]|jgi:hypothetical protein|nr:hypothetical protein ASD15_24100 [Massilia sp. Root351]